MKSRAFLFLAVWSMLLLPVAASQDYGSTEQEQPKLIEIPKDGSSLEKGDQSNLIWIVAVAVAVVAIVFFLIPASSFRKRKR